MQVCVCFIIYWFHVKSVLKYCITYLHTQFVCLVVELVPELSYSPLLAL